MHEYPLEAIPENSIQLIIADPPYFETKGEFDFIWKSFDDYLKDVEKWVIECKRILSNNGTLFWWGSSRRIAYSQIILDKYFYLENSLIWKKKDSRQYQYYSLNSARKFNTQNERLLMYSNVVDKTGHDLIFEEYLKPRNPFALYLRSEFEKWGGSLRDISKLFPSKAGKLTGCVSNWINGENVITKEQYNKIKEYLGNSYLTKEYELLKNEYESLRRIFNPPLKYDEVLEFSQESHITKNYNHPTKKPEKLTRLLIQTTSKPNDIICVPFAGSGTECAMAAKEGRKFIGFDINKKYVDMSNKRAEAYIKQTQIQFE